MWEFVLCEDIDNDIILIQSKNGSDLLKNVYD